MLASQADDGYEGAVPDRNVGPFKGSSVVRLVHAWGEEGSRGVGTLRFFQNSVSTNPMIVQPITA